MIPTRLYVTDDVCNALKFTDSKIVIDIDDFATLTDGPEGGDTNGVAAVYGGRDGAESFALAQEIARRWNAHDDLLAALRFMAAHYVPYRVDGGDPVLLQARAAIARAEGRDA